MISENPKASIAEIFTSIDGEVNSMGQGTISRFVRVAGCNLHCSWCDTKKTQSVEGFGRYTVSDLIDTHLLFPFTLGIPKFTITGGEPLLYPEFIKELIVVLRGLHFQVSVESNGSILIPHFLRGLSCCWILDVKPPSSGHVGSFKHDNLYYLTKNDFLKMVIHTDDDLDWAIEETRYIFRKRERCPQIAWSVSEKSEVAPCHIIEELVQNKLGFVKLNCQMHKFLKLQ